MTERESVCERDRERDVHIKKIEYREKVKIFL